LSAIRGVDDVPLTYVIRRDKPPGWDPETDAANEEEKLIYQVALFGVAFEDHNKVVFSKLMEVTLGEPAYEWIRRFEATKDGRQAMATTTSNYAFPKPIGSSEMLITTTNVLILSNRT
jgi:hypothetical protein